MKKKASRLWTILLCITLVLSILLTSAVFVEKRFQDTINWALGIKATDSKGVGSVKFSSEFTKKDANGETLLNDNGKEVYDDQALIMMAEMFLSEISAARLNEIHDTPAAGGESI